MDPRGSRPHPQQSDEYGTFPAVGLSPLDQLLLPLPTSASAQQRQGAWPAGLPGGLAGLGNPAEQLSLPFLPPDLLAQRQGVNLGAMPGMAAGPFQAQLGAIQPPPPQQQQPPPPKQQVWKVQVQDKDAKQALARQKNREAQQRFRERQRAKLQEANEEYDKIAEEVEKLRLENDALFKQNNIMEKVLTVRDAMMRAFDEFKSVTTEQQLSSLEGQSAEGLIHAIENLPTPEDMDAFASSSEASRSHPEQGQRVQQQGERQEQQQQQQGHGQQGGSSGAGGAAGQEEGSAAAVAAVASSAAASGPAASDASTGPIKSGKRREGEPSRSLSPSLPPDGPLANMWPGMRAGSARDVEIDGSVLERAISIPPPNNHDVVRRIQQWAQPQDLINYWRQWQADVTRCAEAGYAQNWAPDNVQEAEELMRDIIEVWWHAAQIKPGYMVRLIEHGTRKNSAAEDEVSRAIAERIGPEIDEQCRHIMRRAWQQYMKRLAKAAIGVSRWVQRLNQIAGPTQLESMRSVAAGALEIVEITRHMRMAVEEEYLASMEFLANLTASLTQRQKLLINYHAHPYLPDWVGITYYVLRQDPAENVPIHLPPAVTAPVVLQALSAASSRSAVATMPLQQRPPLRRQRPQPQPQP